MHKSGRLPFALSLSKGMIGSIGSGQTARSIPVTLKYTHRKINIPTPGRVGQKNVCL